MALKLPEPLSLPWPLKALSSAKAGIDQLSNGRIKYWIRHDVLKGVTPSMLAWWFRNLEGEIEIGGQRYPRYRVWHPFDHIAIRYARRLPDGSVGPGAVIHIREALGRDPRYLVDIKTRIEKLDEKGFAHVPQFHGLSVVRMEYTFTAVTGGTLYEDCLIVGREGLIWRALRPFVLRFVLDDAFGRAWLKHNVEEVGMFENFLPGLYFRETGQRA
jgi:hypothetical protein